MSTTPVTCTRRMEFDAGHRVLRHEGKCKYLHGHRYVVEATFEAPELDSLGRIVDFGEIKRLLGGWIDTHWDHTTILWDEDRALGEAVAKETAQKIYYLPANPTAENMARYLMEKICPQLFNGSALTCCRLRLYETPNCYAEAEINMR